jgi:hypothetical protein
MIALNVRASSFTLVKLAMPSIVITRAQPEYGEEEGGVVAPMLNDPTDRHTDPRSRSASSSRRGHGWRPKGSKIARRITAGRQSSLISIATIALRRLRLSTRSSAPAWTTPLDTDLASEIVDGRRNILSCTRTPTPLFSALRCRMRQDILSDYCVQRQHKLNFGALQPNKGSPERRFEDCVEIVTK